MIDLSNESLVESEIFEGARLLCVSDKLDDNKVSVFYTAGKIYNVTEIKPDSEFGDHNSDLILSSDKEGRHSWNTTAVISGISGRRKKPCPRFISYDKLSPEHKIIVKLKEPTIV